MMVLVWILIMIIVEIDKRNKEKENNTGNTLMLENIDVFPVLFDLHKPANQEYIIQMLLL